MTHCAICGLESARYRYGKVSHLCDRCDQETPVKVGRAEFEIAYWGEHRDAVPASTRREFYEDYRLSGYGLTDYILSTQAAVE